MSDVVKKVCTCENCGNESEMMITCTLPDEGQAKYVQQEKKVKGSATCSNCGNEAEMWIDL